MTLDSPDDPDGLRHLTAVDDVEFGVLNSGALAEVMADLAKKDPKLHRAALLRLQGYTDADAAREVGLSARALEGRWYRYRNEVRRRRNEAR
jgi:DNA-directed RNA polymerase specialized sigma24 family protein